MERRARAKKPSKISVTHYLNKRVKPVIEESTLIGEEGVMIERYPLYYYITIRRRTIHRASVLSMLLSERDNLEDIREIQKEAQVIKDICAMYLSDLDRGEVNEEVANRTEISAKDRFTGELNAYIRHWADSLEYHYNMCLESRVLGDIAKKMHNALNWEGISNEEVRTMAVKPILKRKGEIKLADCKFIEQNTTRTGQLMLYAWLLVGYISVNLGESYITRYNIEKGTLGSEAWEFIESQRDGIRLSCGLEKLATMSREEYEKELLPMIKKIISTKTLRDLDNI